jgi:hypothetical protein
MNNAFFTKEYKNSWSGGTNKLTNTGANAMSSGLTLTNSFLNTGMREEDAWMAGGNVGQTGFSSMANMGGQMAGQFGPIGAGIQGGLQSIGAMADLFSYNPQVDSIRNSYSSDSLPSFDLSEQASKTDGFIRDFNSSANKKIAQSAIGGAAAGMAFSPIGAAIGGAAGLVGGLIGKGTAKKKAEDANQKMRSEYSEGIDRFNLGTENYYNKENSMDLYRARQQAQDNVFGMPSASPFFYLG